MLAPSQRTPDGAHKKLSSAEVILKDAAFRQALKNLSYIAVWYFLSTLLTLYNKVLLGHKRGLFGDAGFPAPLFMTGVQFFIQWGLASMVLWASCCSPVKSSEPVSWYEWLTKVRTDNRGAGRTSGRTSQCLILGVNSRLDSSSRLPILTHRLLHSCPGSRSSQTLPAQASTLDYPTGPSRTSPFHSTQCANPLFRYGSWYLRLHSGWRRRPGAWRALLLPSASVRRLPP